MFMTMFKFFCISLYQFFFFFFSSRAAYVEFMYKEAADNALSLDGTSFMSRILKVLMSA